MYGFTYEEMKKITVPEKIVKPWGHVIRICNTETYGMKQLFVKKGESQPLHFSMKSEGTLYIEEGKVFLRIVDRQGNTHFVKMAPGDTFEISKGMPFAITGIEDSTSYFFSSTFDTDDYHLIETQEDADNIKADKIEHDDRLKPGKTLDFREKYWGSIESIVSKDYCGKKLVMKKGTQNSLEMHCNKHESYFVHSGSVTVGIRIGRGENKSVSLKAGDLFQIPPGLMHMKIAPSDCVIMEASTKDDDSDSHIVEDGTKYVHKED